MLQGLPPMAQGHERGNAVSTATPPRLIPVMSVPLGGWAVGDRALWVSKEDGKSRVGTVQSVGAVNVYVSSPGRLSVPLAFSEVTKVS